MTTEALWDFIEENMANFFWIKIVNYGYWALKYSNKYHLHFVFLIVYYYVFALKNSL